MKKNLLAGILICLVHSLCAQKSTLPCNCDALEDPVRRYFNDEQKADSLLNVYITELSKYSRWKKTEDAFVVKQAFCTSPVSMICDKPLPNGTSANVRLILYGDLFLKRLNAHQQETTLVDMHVLLHELGHHVLGHLKNAKSIEALQAVYKNEVADPKEWNKYGTGNPMAQELEADIYAVWAISKLKLGFTVDQLLKQFSPAGTNALDKHMELGKHSTHPRFRDRLATMKKYDAELKKTGPGAVGRRYFSDIASTAYLSIWPVSYVYDVAISVGTAVAGKTAFSVGGEKVDAFLYPLSDTLSFHVGLSATRFKWNKPWQIGADLEWSTHKYGTKIQTGDGERLAETIRLNYLTFTPNLIWNSLGISNQQSLRSLRASFIAGLGINLRLPLGKAGYVNYIAAANAPKMHFTAGPKVTVGAALTKKSFLARGAKLLFSYDPQWIRLDASPKPTAISHNFECTLQYSIFRW